MTFEPIFYKPPSATRFLIEQKWQSLKKKGKVWNGAIYRLHNIKNNTQNNHQILDLRLIDFKNHVCSDEYIHLLEASPALFNLPNGINVGAYVVATDKKLIFVEKSDSSILKSKINFIGGNCNKDEYCMERIEDFYNIWEKEWTEETGCGSEIIVRQRPLAMYATKKGRVSVIFVVELSVSSDELLKLSKLNFEHKKMVSVDLHKEFFNSKKYNHLITFSFEDFRKLYDL